MGHLGKTYPHNPRVGQGRGKKRAGQSKSKTPYAKSAYGAPGKDLPPQSESGAGAWKKKGRSKQVKDPIRKIGVWGTRERPTPHNPRVGQGRGKKRAGQSKSKTPYARSAYAAPGTRPVRPARARLCRGPTTAASARFGKRALQNLGIIFCWSCGRGRGRIWGCRGCRRCGWGLRSRRRLF
jgi:hypothetical protein